MSIVWTLIASFLYVEIAVVLLFVLPIASPQRWQRFFKSRFLQMINRQASMYFFLLLAVLVLFLLDAIREMRKYSSTDAPVERHDLGMQHSMRLFRAQRNFYISGFTIFLTLVIRRLVILISDQASLLAQSEASMRQAQSATTAARTLLSQQKAQESVETASDAAAKEEQEQAEKLIAELRTKLDSLNAELVRERKDKEAMQSQAKSLNREYDRLTEEYSKLERAVNRGGSKDD